MPATLVFFPWPKVLPNASAATPAAAPIRHERREILIGMGGVSPYRPADAGAGARTADAIAHWSIGRSAVSNRRLETGDPPSTSTPGAAAGSSRPAMMIRKRELAAGEAGVSLLVQHPCQARRKASCRHGLP